MTIVPKDYREEGLQLVKVAETGLRELLTEAAADGDYDAVAQIMTWARQVQGIVHVVEGGNESPQPVRGEGPSLSSSKDYPKYYRIDNKLLMIGWQKKTQDEYEHKAPRAALDQLVSALLQGSTEKQPMETDALLGSLKSENGERMPDYIGRTFLRWLRSSGLVEKHGHGGYSVKKRDSFVYDVENQWRRLSEKNS